MGGTPGPQTISTRLQGIAEQAVRYLGWLAGQQSYALNGVSSVWHPSNRMRAIFKSGSVVGVGWVTAVSARNLTFFRRAPKYR